MKNIKDITLSIFAIIGFISILSSFNNQPQEDSGRYAISTTMRDSGFIFETIIDTKTGEVVERNNVSIQLYDRVRVF
jgi:predicted small secreted protein